MARDEARIFTRVWGDHDWRGLTVEEQHHYLMLTSDDGMTHCGVTPLALRRWSRQAAGLTERGVRKTLESMAAKRYVVIDWDEDELLVRSLMRNDRVFRQPNVARSAYNSFLRVRSPRLRVHMLFEVHRIHEGPGSEWRSTSFEDDYAGAWLREPFPDGFREGFGEPFPDGLLEAFPGPWPEGFDKACPEGSLTYARARARAPDPLSPLP